METCTEKQFGLAAQSVSFWCRAWVSILAVREHRASLLVPAQRDGDEGQ